MTGAPISTRNGLDRALTDLLRASLKSGPAGFVLIPLEVPAGDSYAYVMVSSPELLERARALPPVMGIQGATALASVSRLVSDEGLIAVMRPCEMRAAVELAKLEQIDLSCVTFVTVDCPGAVPLAAYLGGAVEGPRWSDESSVRPVCRTCVNFAATGDLHVATLGLDEGTALLVPTSEKAEALLERLGIQADSELGAWENEVEKLAAGRREARSIAHEKLAAEVGGLENLVEFFNACIGCHNCGRACPVCYCRQCFIDSGERDAPASQYLDRARNAGALRLPTDTVLFHVGRMAHMSLSRVSCGACEDACPADIPVARLFGMVAGRTQAIFDYEPGSDAAQPAPLATYEEDELHAVED